MEPVFCPATALVLNRFLPRLLPVPYHRAGDPLPGGIEGRGLCKGHLVGEAGLERDVGSRELQPPEQVSPKGLEKQEGRGGAAHHQVSVGKGEGDLLAIHGDSPWGRATRAR